MNEARFIRMKEYLHDAENPRPRLNRRRSGERASIGRPLSSKRPEADVEILYDPSALTIDQEKDFGHRSDAHRFDGRHLSPFHGHRSPGKRSFL
jgi:hypothetical protein